MTEDPLSVAVIQSKEILPSLINSSPRFDERFSHTFNVPPHQSYLLNRLARDVRKIPDGQKDERGQADQHDYRIHGRTPPMCIVRASAGSCETSLPQ